MIKTFLIWGIKVTVTNLHVDNLFRSWILTVAFDRSEEEKRKFREIRSMSISITLDAQEDRKQEVTKESNEHQDAKNVLKLKSLS